MLIVSAKVSKKKVLLGIIAAVCVILLLVFLLQESDNTTSDPDEPSVPSNAGGTNEERLAFLRSFGWEPDETPAETQEVRIPKEFNDVFTRYNELQKSQGYDLTSYAGKAVKRYVYRMTNHPDGQDRYATLLVYRNEIIGGDVTGMGQDKVMQGFVMVT